MKEKKWETLALFFSRNFLSLCEGGPLRSLRDEEERAAAWIPDDLLLRHRQPTPNFSFSRGKERREKKPTLQRLRMPPSPPRKGGFHEICVKYFSRQTIGYIIRQCGVSPMRPLARIHFELTNFNSWETVPWIGESMVPPSEKKFSYPPNNKASRGSRKKLCRGKNLHSFFSLWNYFNCVL